VLMLLGRLGHGWLQSTLTPGASSLQVICLILHSPLPRPLPVINSS
jgi:hypothetical protein